MALLSGSTRRPTVAIGPPSAGIHAHVVSLTKPSVQTVRAAPNASAIAPIDTRPARGPTRRSGATTARRTKATKGSPRSEEHTSELQSRLHLVCRLLLEKKNITKKLPFGT